MDNNNANRGGVSFFGLLTIAFIVLKLCGVINWSWWWVFAPIWIPLALVMVLVLVLATIKVLSKKED